MIDLLRFFNDTLISYIINLHCNKLVSSSLQQLSKISQSQSEHVEFKLASAFSIPFLQNESVDLITVGQGLHWLSPHELFFQEVIRLLKPNGHFVAVSHRTAQIISDPELQSLHLEYYFGTLGSLKQPGEVGCYWDINRSSIDNFYSDINFPANTTIYRTEFDSESPQIEMTFDDFFGFLRSVSAYQNFLATNRELEDPLIELKRKFEVVNKAKKMIVKFPYFSISFSKRS